MHLCLLFFLPICLLTFANLSYFMETETNGKKCKIDKHFLKMFCKVPKDYNSTATGVLVCLNGKSFQWPLLPTLNPALCGQMCFIFSGFTDTDSARHSAQQNIRPLSRAHLYQQLWTLFPFSRLSDSPIDYRIESIYNIKECNQKIQKIIDPM